MFNVKAQVCVTCINTDTETNTHTQTHTGNPPVADIKRLPASPSQTEIAQERKN